MKDVEKLEEDMKPRLIEDLGMRFMTEKSSRKYRYGLYECQYCGKHWEVVMGSVKCGYTKSCGCLKGEGHGLSGHKLYGTWRQMVQRCTNPKHKNYGDYGARGITVCEEWLNVSNFVAWAEKTYPNLEGYTLDRIDNGKGYSPENCTWSDKTTQAINRRIQKNNTSEYVGVIWHKRGKRWVVSIKINKKPINLGCFKDKIEAVQARDNYIIENNLPHKLSGLTKNEKDKR